jgi:hypothetical protein
VLRRAPKLRAKAQASRVSVQRPEHQAEVAKGDVELLGRGLFVSRFTMIPQSHAPTSGADHRRHDHDQARGDLDTPDEVHEVLRTARRRVMSSG